MLFVKALNGTLRSLLESDSRVILLGEDLIDPYGGAFKVTKGLSTDFPDRVLTTPVSEAAIAGVAGGLALAGFRPIAEFMFGDFTTLCFDQVVNHLSKFHSMYDGQVNCPVILRTPMGGGRAYGPTHSQSLEKFYFGVPGLTVAAASLFQNPQPLFETFLGGLNPVFFVEHKLLYAQECRLPENGRCGMFESETVASDGFLPTLFLRPVERADCHATVIAYGHSGGVVAKIAEQLAVKREIFLEVVIPSQISPVDWVALEISAESTRRVIVCEEGTAGWNWGAEVSGQLNARLFGRLRQPIRRIASDDSLIPSGKQQEEQMLFGEKRALTAMMEVLG
jgi:pyruvate/2-oxoglutarate/acetoin dehydrogenase E1 component